MTQSRVLHVSSQVLLFFNSGLKATTSRILEQAKICQTTIVCTAGIVQNITQNNHPIQSGKKQSPNTTHTLFTGCRPFLAAVGPAAPTHPTLKNIDFQGWLSICFQKSFCRGGYVLIGQLKNESSLQIVFQDLQIWV